MSTQVVVAAVLVHRCEESYLQSERAAGVGAVLTLLCLTVKNGILHIYI